MTKPGQPCPTCGKGWDSDKDGNCAFCSGLIADRIGQTIVYVVEGHVVHEFDYVYGVFADPRVAKANAEALWADRGVGSVDSVTVTAWEVSRRVYRKEPISVVLTLQHPEREPLPPEPADLPSEDSARYERQPDGTIKRTK